MLQCSDRCHRPTAPSPTSWLLQEQMLHWPFHNAAYHPGTVAVVELRHHALFCNPQGKKKRGRPGNTWRRYLEAEVGITGLTWGHLEKLAQERDVWKAFVGSLCPGNSSPALNLTVVKVLMMNFCLAGVTQVFNHSFCQI